MKLEHTQKRAECIVHQNRAKRQKKDVDYLEMNIGKGHAQPRSKPRPKKIDIVAALREPTETPLAAHQIQLDCQSSQPGQILGVAIKSEIKTEIKQELEQTNTRHKYKGKPLWGKAHYIHPDGTPCKCFMQKESELPDLPDLNDSESVPTKRLQVETAIQSANQDLEQKMTMPPRNTEDLNIVSTAILTGLLIETPGIATSNALQNPNNEPDTTNI